MDLEYKALFLKELSKRPDLFDPEHLYYHCCWHGGVYYDSNFEILVLDIKKITGNSRIPSCLTELLPKISSGICKKCLSEYLNYIQRDLLKLKGSQI